VELLDLADLHSCAQLKRASILHIKRNRIALMMSDNS
jgi:hypothetical protein